MKTQLTILAILATFSTGVATAGDVTGLTTFTSGTKAVAAEVNDNFTAVKTAVDDNNSRTTTNTTAITTNTNDIAANGAADTAAAIDVCTLYQLLSGTGTVGVLPIPVGCPTFPRTVFVTSTTYDGNLGGLAGADAKCQTQAAAGGLSGTFKAWLSIATTAAASRLSHTADVYETTNGDVIAADFAALTNTANVDLAHAIDVDEFGNTVTGEFAWTATTSTGDFVPNSKTCNDWTDEQFLTGARVGQTGQVNGAWTNIGTATCDNLRRLYCIQQ